jgi:hypothetical protein
MLGFVAVALLAGACVDVEGGESGTYGSPCSNYGGLLLCGRENGGADPQGSGGGGGGAGAPAGNTCNDACEVAAGCFPGEIDLAECESQCAQQPIPQPLIDCIVDNGCNYPNVCFDQAAGN